MPLPLLLRPRPLFASAARLLTVVAIVVGLLGMHVLTAPSSHGAHGAVEATGLGRTQAAVVAPAGSPADSADTAATGTAHAGAPHSGAAASCVEGCADPSGGARLATWAVMCMLALLLTALLVLPRGGSWRMPWCELRRSATPAADAHDRAPRHPPSLIVLSISRT